MSTPAAALNRPQHCVQQLSDFDCAMGWAFQDLTLHDDHEPDDDDDVARVHRDRKRREHTHTAFDQRVEIPPDFVAPRGAHPTRLKAATAAVSSHPSKKKTKKSAVHSAAYSTRPTGPAARPTLVSIDRTSRRRSPSPPQKHRHPPPVDFVYDVGVRRALREQLDAARLATRREAALRETTLRAAHAWVQTDDHDHHHTRQDPRKQAWSTTNAASPQKTPKPRAVSAKTAIAPNVSEWRTQETPFHALPADAQRRLREQQQRQQQQREAGDVARALDAFDAQWG